MARGLGTLILVLTAVLGILLASGLIDLTGPLSPGEDEQADADHAATGLTAEAIVSDGVAAAPVDLLGRPVQEEDEERPVVSGYRAGSVSALGRLSIPGAGMDVPLGSIARTAVVRPPGYRAAYVLDRSGSELASPDAASHTTVIAMHSVNNGFAPGNYLVSADGSARVVAGDRIETLAHEWVITGIEQIAKDDVPGREEIWGDEPGTLVLVTCRQNGKEHTTENTVIFARIIS